MSPVALVWQADVVSISAENREGVFDILPDHARFMSIINTAPVSIEGIDGTVKSFTFENAVLFFEDNKAVIYIQEQVAEMKE